MDGFEVLWTLAPNLQARTELESWLVERYNVPTNPRNRIYAVKQNGLQIQVGHIDLKSGDNLFPAGVWPAVRTKSSVAEMLATLRYTRHESKVGNLKAEASVPIWYFANHCGLNQLKGPDEFIAGFETYLKNDPLWCNRLW